MAGSASHTSPTPEWAGEQEKLRTCHRVPGKWNEDTVRKQSEITPDGLLCGEQRGGGVVPQAPRSCISFQCGLTLVSHLFSLPSTNQLPLLCSLAIPTDKRHIISLKKKKVDAFLGLKSKKEKKIPNPFLVECTEAVSGAFLNINIIIR